MVNSHLNLENDDYQKREGAEVIRREAYHPLLMRDGYLYAIICITPTCSSLKYTSVIITQRPWVSGKFQAQVREFE